MAADEYYSVYIAWAAGNGIVNGVGEDEFAPDRAVSREEAAVMFVRYAEFAGLKLIEEEGIEDESSFADADKISPWAKDSVEKIKVAGIIKGKDNNVFDPQGTATRAEIAKIFVELINRGEN